MPAYEVVVKGKVQGVYFRDFTRRTAQAQGARGWVRNEADGSVRALLQHADEAVLQSMLAALASGPPGSLVTGLSWNRVAEHDELVGFEILR